MTTFTPEFIAQQLTRFHDDDDARMHYANALREIQRLHANPADSVYPGERPDSVLRALDGECAGVADMRSAAHLIRWGGHEIERLRERERLLVAELAAMEALRQRGASIEQVSAFSQARSARIAAGIVVEDKPC